jgi:hypothetical protein
MSNKWVVKDSEGNVTNHCIKADEEFMAATYSYYEAFVEIAEPVISDAEEARIWRDVELQNTDFIVPTTDHPEHAAYIAYRAALRDWPSTSDFPDTKPVLGS